VCRRCNKITCGKSPGKFAFRQLSLPANGKMLRYFEISSSRYKLVNAGDNFAVIIAPWPCPLFSPLDLSFQYNNTVLFHSIRTRVGHGTGVSEFLISTLAKLRRILSFWSTFSDPNFPYFFLCGFGQRLWDRGLVGHFGQIEEVWDAGRPNWPR